MAKATQAVAGQTAKSLRNRRRLPSMDQKSPRTSAMNLVWLFLLLSSVLVGAATGRLEDVGKTPFQAAKQSVDLAIGLVGAMTLWLGLVKVVQEAGLMAALSKALEAFTGEASFPDVPAVLIRPWATTGHEHGC